MDDTLSDRFSAAKEGTAVVIFVEVRLCHTRSDRHHCDGLFAEPWRLDHK
jgi:hypothetical protein